MSAITETMKRFNASVCREGDVSVAQCLDVHIASQGDTEEEALEALREALVALGPEAV